MNRELQKIGVLLLISGIIICLLIRFYNLSSLSDVDFIYKIITFLFGNWLGNIYLVKMKFGVIKFEMINLLGLPWAALILIFLLWYGLKTIHLRSMTKLRIIVNIFGIWMIISLIFEKIEYGFYTYRYPIAIIFDFASIFMIAGIGLIAYTHYNIKSNELSLKSRDNLSKTKCPYCSKEISLTAKFCKNCGRKL